MNGRPKRVEWATAVALSLSVPGCAGNGRAATAPAEDSLLRQTWDAYQARFMEADGRVVDIKAGGITTSEGQAYAMLRAVWMRDRAVFDRAHGWAVEHLNRGVRSDRLWAWRWQGRVTDPAFASDADQDAALSLIMAARTWNDPSYLERARAVLADLWEKGTIVAGGRRYLLGGDTLCQGRTCRLNPSYYAPYAYRYFAREDPSRPWGELVDTTYVLLERNAALTSTRLPSDWILLDTRTGELSPGSEQDSQFSYDALRVHWRIRLDGVLFGEPRSASYLRSSLAWAADRWRREGRLPAAISAGGEARVEYEAPEMQATMMAAMEDWAGDVAASMDQRLQASLAGGIWGDRESQYLQNWAWFGTALRRRSLAPFDRLR